jgi:CubicO group peptidase (beta-lactamase class C family)
MSLEGVITAAAIMHLVEQGLLNLDEPALPMLPDWPDCAARMVDGRLGYVTIRQLLQHSGGWNSRIAPDPMFASLDIVRTMNVPRPASTESTIRYMCGQPMQFTPGTGYAYSNFGYAILGRLIERVTGMNYEAYVRTAVLDPMGILRMRQGRTLPEGRFASEVKYYGSEFLPSVFT